MAQLIDYNHVRLDLYRAAGFTKCEPYPESEIPPISIRDGSPCAAL